jgi:nitrate/nitrite transporter NarK
VTSARAVFWTIPTRFLTGVAAAGGLAFINMIGTTGGYFGPALMGWLRQETGSFEAGLLAMSGIMVASTAVAATLWLVMQRE